MRHTWRVLLYAPMLLIALSAGANAQDANYWMLQYGTRADLLGGSVVGSLLDLSNTYYNPGALMLLKDPSLLVGVSALRYGEITLKNAGGKGIDLTDRQLRPAPSFLAGSFTIESLKNHYWAYSLLTRNDFNAEFRGRVAGVSDVIESWPGVEDASAELIAWERLVEGWGGITWARKLGDHSGLGITQYIAVRSQNSRLQAYGVAVSPDSLGASRSAVNEFQYYHVRLVWKIGLAHDMGPVTLGLTVTTPGLGLFGDGSIYYSVSSIDGGQQGSWLEYDYSEGLSVKYRSPLSVAGGFAWHFGRSALHFSAEWFDAVPHYVVMQGDEQQALGAGDPNPDAVSHQLKSVTNFAVGLTHLFQKGFMGYASFRTDYSARPTRGVQDLALSSWNIYHLGLGAEFRLGGIGLTLGGGYSFGGQEYEMPGGLIGADQDDEITGSVGTTQAQYRQVKLIIGIAIPGAGPTLEGDS